MILAGGHSRRMGTDKALLRLSNAQTLLAHTAQIAQALTSEVVIVTPWPERYAAALPQAVRWVQEAAHPYGPLGGFAQGWDAIQTEWCLVLACDLPQLAYAPLREWWVWLQREASVKGAIASLTYRKQTHRRQPVELNLIEFDKIQFDKTEFDKTEHEKNETPKIWEPLCGFYHRDCLRSLRDRFASYEKSQNSVLDTERSRRLSFQSWLKPLPILAYDQLPQAILFNCNTADDWAQIQS